MIQTPSFLKNLFFSILFSLSITQSFASERSASFFTVNSMEELLPSLEKNGIKLGPNTALYIDNDETVGGARFNINPEVEGDLPPLNFLCCPDLARTYTDVLEAAATLLHKENDGIPLCKYKAIIRQANFDVCTWNDQPWRHLEAVPLESDSLAAFLSVARTRHSLLKICSGLQLTFNKISFFETYQETLGFKTCSLKEYHYGIRETGDYLYAPRGKHVRILQDLTTGVPFGNPLDAGRSEAPTRVPSDIDTIILIDNAPTACKSFLEGMTPDNLVKHGLSPDTRIIAIQYDFFKKVITPEKVAEEYKLWVRFLEVQEEIRRTQEPRRYAFLRGSSDTDSGYDTNPDSASLTASIDGTPYKPISSSDGELKEQEEYGLSSGLDDEEETSEERDFRSGSSENNQKDY